MSNKSGIEGWGNMPEVEKKPKEDDKRIMKDGTVVDMTDKTPEEIKEELDAYNLN